MKDLVKVKSKLTGEVFNVYYEPNLMCWLQEGTHQYYDIDDWGEVIEKIKD